jgi:predicted RNA-binding protein with PIN domain
MENNIKGGLIAPETKVTNSKYFTVMQYCSWHSVKINFKQEAYWKKEAALLSKRMGYPIKKVYVKHLGTIDSYAEKVLNSLYKRMLDEISFDSKVTFV